MTTLTRLQSYRRQAGAYKHYLRADFQTGAALRRAARKKPTDRQYDNEWSDFTSVRLMRESSLTEYLNTALVGKKIEQGQCHALLIHSNMTLMNPA